MRNQCFGISLTIMLLAAPCGADETLAWNEVMLDAIVASTLGNPPTIRMAATVNSAMFDAQNAVGRHRYKPIFVTERAPHGTDRRAAVIQAAYVTLKSFYPEQLSRFDQQRASSFAELGGDHSPEVQRGIEWGEYVANQVLAWRATDGFSDPAPPFTGAGAVIGQWESAIGTSMAGGNIALTAPFVLNSPTQFQAALPRPWTSLITPEYASDFNEVAQLGAQSSSSRTLDQTHIAFFFNGYATSDYIEAAIQLARKHKTARHDNASHPGSHGAGPRVLQHFFGDRNTFEVHPAFNTVFPGPAEGGVKPRRYSRISRMAQEGIDARTYGGMHFRGSSNAAARVGAEIAEYVLENAAQPIR